ncbi:9840_t:CDS:2, partial [Acaulospora morrowiae]
MSLLHILFIGLIYLPSILAKLKGLKSLKNDEPLDINAQWSPEDSHCINVLTPPPNTILAPYYRVYIRWSTDPECDPMNKLTNFLITLHNDPKSSGNSIVTYGSEPKITSKWSQPITSNVISNEFLWTVPLIQQDDGFGSSAIKNTSLFYIRIETEAMIDDHMRTAFGITGPLTIKSNPDKENKTLFAPVKEVLKAQVLSSSNGSTFKNVSSGIIQVKILWKWVCDMVTRRGKIGKMNENELDASRTHT